jgi:hypothetical protein
MKAIHVESNSLGMLTSSVTINLTDQSSGAGAAGAEI